MHRVIQGYGYGLFCGKLDLYAEVRLKTFSEQVFLYQGARSVDPHGIQVFMPLLDSLSAVARGTTTGHFSKQLTPTHPFPEKILVV
jgi:hypothetical protein